MMLDMTVEGELTLLRDTTRQFIEDEINPHREAWRRQKCVDRSLWRKAGEVGLLGASLPEIYGGSGGDFRYEAVIYEELGRADFVDFGITIHSGIVVPYFLHLGTAQQRETWLPRLASGETIAAVAMSEPDAGSDLQAMRTTALRDGDDYVIRGQKTFISNGQLADVVIVAAKTDPSARGKGVSLFIVEASRDGFRRGRNLHKIGLHAQDTSELFFDDVRVPAENLLGGVEGQGFKQLMTMLPQERMVIAIQGLGSIDRAIEETIRYTKDRRAFGKPLYEMQNTRFLLAEVSTEARLARIFIDRCITDLIAGKLDIATAAMAKYWVTDKQCEIIDRCLQLFGGYGYMDEYPISQLYLNARAQRIYGGANEVMKEIIARSL
jgi:acyl-CoA dehydrogenase